MQTPQAVPTPPEPQRHLVDLQYEEVARHRTAILNREMIRMRGEGWNVQLAGDQLVATRRDAGRSQLERTLLAVAGVLLIAYAATIAVPDQVAKPPISKLEFLGAAVLLGVVGAFLSRGQAARERRVTVSLDGQGRPFVTEQSARDL